MTRRLWARLIRCAFWVLYNPLARIYDWVSWAVSLGHWREWQRAALPELRGRQVLELAFGTGDLLLDLHKAGYHPTGIDLSPAMGRFAQRKLAKVGLALPLVRGRAQQLPFAAASFDSVLCTFPAEFIASAETLHQIARVLCPEGRAVIVAMGKLVSNDPWARLLEWLYWITGQRGPLPDLRPTLEPLGLKHRAMWVRVGSSEALLIVIEKKVDVSRALEYTGTYPDVTLYTTR